MTLKVLAKKTKLELLQKLYSFLPLHDKMYGLRHDYRVDNYCAIVDHVAVEVYRGRRPDAETYFKAKYGPSVEVSAVVMSKW
jgi:hypothetical protein